MGNRKVILYISMSLDGFIARQNDDIEWLSLVEKKGEDYGYNEFYNTIDTVIMGRRTYEKVLSFGIDFPHRNKKCFVFSSAKTFIDPYVTFVDQSPEIWLKKYKTTEGGDIYCDGGATLVHTLLKYGLIDEMVISIIPILLGEGKRLFSRHLPENSVKLINSNTFDTGLVQLTYKILIKK
ncbi:MAG: dihydrofolate reductase family protein [Bacteroidota bacterium]|nr:dihydrofolate reductase family protein [Bacteroidota bacterium]